jgi:hypothetical protein
VFDVPLLEKTPVFSGRFLEAPKDSPDFGYKLFLVSGLNFRMQRLLGQVIEVFIGIQLRRVGGKEEQLD